MSYGRRQFAGAAPDSTLSTGIGAGDLTFTGTDLTGWPDGTTGKFVVIFDPDLATEEHALGSSRTGNTVTFASTADRGVDNTTAQAHSSMGVVRHGLSKVDVDEANYAVSQTVGQVAAKGDLLVGSAANTLTKVSAGSTGQVPIWQPDGSVAPGAPVPAAHTHVETDVTSLTTDLGNKLAKPTTAFAKGSLLVGTGSGTYDTLAAGVDGKILTADSTVAAGVSWATPTVAQLLAVLDHPEAKTVTVDNNASPILHVIDGTNLVSSFVAPASGKVLVRISGLLTWNSTGTTSVGVGLLNSGSQTALGRTMMVLGGVSNAAGSPAFSVASTITGLTPGSTYSFLLGGYTASTTSSPAATITNPVVEVWSAS